VDVSKKKGKVQRDCRPGIVTLNPGDFVVHVDYGIGKYIGLEKYRSETWNVNVLRCSIRTVTSWRTGGQNGTCPNTGVARTSCVLSKLGGVQWEKLKHKTKESVKAIAKG
jgi:transcription-repair coupling factor (superfamily II helicase)